MRLWVALRKKREFTCQNPHVINHKGPVSTAPVDLGVTIPLDGAACPHEAAEGEEGENSTKDDEQHDWLVEPAYLVYRLLQQRCQRQCQSPGQIKAWDTLMGLRKRTLQSMGTNESQLQVDRGVQPVAPAYNSTAPKTIMSRLTRRRMHLESTAGVQSSISRCGTAS